ncbi:MAG: hypothetical protein NTU64_11710 [Hyphomicrobiales bacterium]|nr:hypothetical protein [Hyphomicrobiales bacterium]
MRADTRGAQRKNYFQKTVRATPSAGVNRQKSSESVQVIRETHRHASKIFARRTLMHTVAGRLDGKNLPADARTWRLRGDMRALCRSAAKLSNATR